MSTLLRSENVFRHAHCRPDFGNTLQLHSQPQLTPFFFKADAQVVHGVCALGRDRQMFGNLTGRDAGTAVGVLE